MDLCICSNVMYRSAGRLGLVATYIYAQLTLIVHEASQLHVAITLALTCIGMVTFQKHMELQTLWLHCPLLRSTIYASTSVSTSCSVVVIAWHILQRGGSC